MKRLSLAELKSQSSNVVANLEAIKGGNAAGCHCSSGTPSFDPISAATTAIGAAFAAFIIAAYESSKAEAEAMYNLFK